MNDQRSPQSRREFLGSLAAGALAAGAMPRLISASERRQVQSDLFD